MLRWDWAGHSISPPTHHLPNELEAYLGEDFSNCTTLISSEICTPLPSLLSLWPSHKGDVWGGRCMDVTVCVSCAVVSNSFQPHGLVHQAPLAFGSPGKNTVVGCVALLQGFFLTQGLNPDFRHCGQILYHLSYLGSLNVIQEGQKIMLNLRVPLRLGFESFVKS